MNIKRIIREEMDNDVSWIKKIKPSFKVIEDEILKNSYLEIDSEKWVSPVYERILYSMSRPKKEEYFKDKYGVDKYDKINGITNNVIDRINKMKKRYGFAFEHRLPYFDYPLSLYDLELAIKKEDNDF